MRTLHTVHKPVYMTVYNENYDRWEQMPQRYLGIISWDLALRLAFKQNTKVRLCHSPGYNNQGHYLTRPLSAQEFLKDFKP